MAVSSPTTALDELERQVVDHLFTLLPAHAVGIGLHQYDGRLPELARDATDGWASTADRLLQRLASVPRESLREDRQVDRFLLRLLLESPLFDLREAGELEHNPMSYVGAFSLTPYLIRDYAPAADRVQAIVRTLEAVPSVLEAGRRRLAGPLPKPYVELALSIGAGLPVHFAEGEAFAASAGLADTVREPRAVAEAAIARFLSWLHQEELGRAVPEFALGPARYQRLLFVREGVEASFEEMRKAGAADLARNQSRLAEIAHSEGLPVEALFRRIGDDHPRASEIIPTANRCVEEARAFVLDQHLASIPEPTAVRVEETPPFGRALSTASMDSPGPFDPGPEGVYYVTPVDSKWNPTQQDEWLRSLNRTMLRNITVHEVYPGHYLQFLHLRRAGGSLTRRVYRSPSFVEGWAHYCEQLVVEAGLGLPSHDAEVAQIHDALLRDGRLLVSIGLHTGGWSLTQATEFLMREAHMDRLPAEREAIRGTYDPVYFCYTLGKLAILDARRHLLASRFGGRLQEFHDALLALGAPPIGLLEAMLARPDLP